MYDCIQAGKISSTLFDIYPPHRASNRARRARKPRRGHREIARAKPHSARSSSSPRPRRRARAASMVKTTCRNSPSVQRLPAERRLSCRKVKPLLPDFFYHSFGDIAMLEGALALWYLLTAASIVFMIYDLATNTPAMGVMKAAWVLITLYLGPIGLFVYLLSCRQPLPGTHDAFI